MLRPRRSHAGGRRRPGDRLARRCAHEPNRFEHPCRKRFGEPRPKRFCQYGPTGFQPVPPGRFNAGYRHRSGDRGPKRFGGSRRKRFGRYRPPRVDHVGVDRNLAPKHDGVGPFSPTMRSKTGHVWGVGFPAREWRHLNSVERSRARTARFVTRVSRAASELASLHPFYRCSTSSPGRRQPPGRCRRAALRNAVPASHFEFTPNPKT